MRFCCGVFVSALFLIAGSCVDTLPADSGGGNAPPPNADPQASCAGACHGENESNAPPKNLKGQTSTSDAGVGAHTAHLAASPTWHAAMACNDCHAVPATVDAAGHMDGDGKVELTFSAKAGANAKWDGTACTTACHGSAALGGTAPQPKWLQVDGTQSTCGSCHATLPPAPHPQNRDCAKCHPTMEADNKTFRDPASHINGKVDYVADGSGGACGSCHGTATNAAPPKDLAGNVDPTKPGVGAHAAHLKTSNWHRDVQCASCHVVPASDAAPTHRDGDNIAEVKFDTLNPQGAYNKTAATCGTTYCHGNGRGNNGDDSWVATADMVCTSCHTMTGTGQSGDHRKHIGGEGMTCSECHQTVVNANNTIIDAKLHINGVHEVKMANGTWDANNRSCANTGCHRTLTW